jgi:hypothetical protein
MSDLPTVDANDYTALARFLTEYPHETQTSEYWLARFRHWWDANPAFGPDTPRGWLLRDEEAGGDIVGFLGNVPSRFMTEAGEITAYSATTWRVRPEYRTSSIHLYLAQIEAGEGRVLFNNTPNDNVVRVLRYLKFDSRPSYSSGRAFLVALRPASVLGGYLARLALPRTLGALFSPAIHFAQIPCALLLCGNSVDRVRVVDRADTAFDALWQRTRGLYNTTVRSAAQLNWLCFGNPYARRILLGYFDGEQLRGFMVLGSASWRGVQTLECLDLWLDIRDDHHVATALIAGAVRHAQGSGADLLVLHAYTPRLAALFRRLGIVFTRQDTRQVFFRADAALTANLGSISTYLTALEGDLAV